MKRHTGIHEHRIAESPLEASIARRWRQDCERGLLDHILSCGGTADVSLRDEAVAATVIQWLGSHVGQSFLREIAKKETCDK